MGNDDQPLELPYATAQRMRSEGADDATIIAALMRSGLSEDDAKFAVNSLPGGALDAGAGGSAPPLQAKGGTGKTDLPLMGIALIVLGVAATAFSYLTATGGRYYIWWGLIVVGVIRLIQGR